MAVVIKLPTKKTEKPSYEDVLGMVKSLAKESTHDAIKQVLTCLAVGKFDPLETDTIISMIASKIKVGKTPLKLLLKTIIQEQGLVPNDLALEVARTVRNQSFNGGSHLFRCPDGAYWVFNGTHCRRTTKANLRKLIMEEANKVRHRYEGKNLSTLVNSAMQCLDDLLGTDEDVMGFNDEPLPVINCLNGELWIGEDGEVELMPHRPESRQTYCLPLEYDPKATCPMYDKTLSEIFGKADDPENLVRHWLEFMGYAIQPCRDIASFWMLIGNGNNGKSKLLETLQKLVGPDAVINDQISSFQRDRFNVAALVGKILLIDDDLPEGVTLADGFLKKISEAKEISARNPYGREKFKFRCLALPVMAGNTYPMTKDCSGGMFRRVQIIPFYKKFGTDEADPTLFPKIWEHELSGILNRALQGLQRLRKRGGFDVPKDSQTAFTRFMTQANPLIDFIKEQCVQKDEGRIFIKDMRATMKQWAAENGVLGVPSATKLRYKLEGLEFYVGTTDGKRCVHGLSLKELD